MIRKLVARVKRIEMTTLVKISAAFTILGLILMVWSLLVPTPLPVMLAMSVGQAFGTSAFLLYLFAIVIDLRRERRARREAQQNLERA
jgi:hypothetical protein